MTLMLSYGLCLKEEAMNFALYTRDYGGIFVLNTMYIKMSSVSYLDKFERLLISERRCSSSVKPTAGLRRIEETV